jgi:hypothetical protein
MGRDVPLIFPGDVNAMRVNNISPDNETGADYACPDEY